MLRYVLRAKLGLVPDRDVKLLVVGEPALGLQSLGTRHRRRRAAQHAAQLGCQEIGLPRAGELRETGHHLSFEHRDDAPTDRRQKSGAHRAVLKTLIEGLYIFKTQKDKSLAVMKKNLRGGSDEILRETYQLTVGEMEQSPIPSLQVIKSGLDILSLQ